jgi:hypothetical protein
MSRYPGTQFKVYDNSQATAAVPINTSVNEKDTVRYISVFESAKGPENITSVYGQDFYDKYGDQSTIKFDKYGQPLFQASMNINNGAALYAKRVVLDDATLANATLAIVLTKYADGKIELETDDDHKGLIKQISFTDTSKTTAKYSLSSLMFSLDNTDGYSIANTVVTEFKERYGMYKDKLIDIISNEANTNSKFLNRVDDANPVLSGFANSIYYDADGNVITNISDPTEVQKVRKINSFSTGLFRGDQKTISSSFDPSDIIGDNSFVRVYPIQDTAYITGTQGDYTIVMFVKKNGNVDAHWEVSTKVDSYKDIATIPLERFVTTMDELNALVKDEWKEADFVIPDGGIYALVEGTVTTEDDIVDGVVTASSTIDTEGYITGAGTKDTIRLLNDIMIKKSGYVVCEYVFPMFTVFDNGRGESTKSISIEYDANSSMSMKKAIYYLNIYNYATGKRLERFSFSLNPYARNNTTGYTFDIESAVNYKSNQISVNTYYDSYDKLLATLQEILESADDTIIENYDIVFGHLLNGNFPAFNTYQSSTMLRKYSSVTDYAHLDVFGNPIVTVNVFADSDNMSITTDQLVKYYFYNFDRTKQNILERLAKGTDGYCLDRIADPSNKNIPFLVIDYTDTEHNFEDVAAVKSTGLPNGYTVIPTTSMADLPKVEHNFIATKVNLTSATGYYTDPTDDTQKTVSVYLVDSSATVNRDDVFPSTTTVSSPDFLERRAAFPYEPTYIMGTTVEQNVVVYIPYSRSRLIQEHYKRFFDGDFDRDIFNLDVYFPNAVFDANFDDDVKLAIQRLAAFRGDFMCYMDMGLGQVHSYEDCVAKVPGTLAGQYLTSETAETGKPYVRDMHVAVTCLSYKIRNPYDNKVIYVTATYGLSNIYIAIYKSSPNTIFAGISNGVTISGIIEGSVGYIPKIYPTSAMTSLLNIGNVYPSEDETITNEKQLMNDLKVNYGCYYDDRFSIETEYTLHPFESEFSYWNNVALVCAMMQSIRRACPAARYKFITSNDLNVYQAAVETAMEPWRNKFATLRFRYVQDQTAIEKKIFYAAIEVAFQPFAQAEIFELTALNYSTVSNGTATI